MKICLRCGNCCSRFQVLVEQHELERISGYLGISQARLVEEYSDPRWPVAGKYLIQHRQGGCAFLKKEGRQYLCSIHPVKPQPCRDWEFSLGRSECRQGLETSWQLTVNAYDEPSGSPENLERLHAYLDSISG